MTEKRPTAICTKCGAYTYEWADTNTRCKKKYLKTGRCKGTYKGNLISTEVQL